MDELALTESSPRSYTALTRFRAHPLTGFPHTDLTEYPPNRDLPACPPIPPLDPDELRAMHLEWERRPCLGTAHAFRQWTAYLHQLLEPEGMSGALIEQTELEDPPHADELMQIAYRPTNFLHQHTQSLAWYGTYPSPEDLYMVEFKLAAWLMLKAKSGIGVIQRLALVCDTFGITPPMAKVVLSRITAAAAYYHTEDPIFERLALEEQLNEIANSSLSSAAARLNAIKTLAMLKGLFQREDDKVNDGVRVLIEAFDQHEFQEDSPPALPTRPGVGGEPPRIIEAHPMAARAPQDPERPQTLEELGYRPDAQDGPDREPQRRRAPTKKRFDW